ncbi:MAG TPA: hypothetical protein VIK81_04935 [Patescibacteria group bacterium]
MGKSNPSTTLGVNYKLLFFVILTIVLSAIVIFALVWYLESLTTQTVPGR